MACHYLDQPVGDIAWKSVHDPEPVHFGNLICHSFEQARQSVLHPQVMTVIGGILGNQDEFAHSLFVQAMSILQDHFRRAADGTAFDKRDGTERTRTAAAIRDLEVSARSEYAGPQHLDRTVFIHQRRGFRQVVERFGAGTFAQFTHYTHNIHPAPGTENSVHAGYPPGHFQAIPLGQTPGGDEQLTRAFGFRQAT